MWSPVEAQGTLLLLARLLPTSPEIGKIWTPPRFDFYEVKLSKIWINCYLRNTCERQSMNSPALARRSNLAHHCILQPDDEMQNWYSGGETQNFLRMRLKSSKTHLLAYRAGCTTLAWVLSSFLMACTVSSSTMLKMMVMVIIATTIANSQRPIVRRQVVGQPLTSFHPGTLRLLRTVAATAPSLLLQGKIKSSRSLFTLSILRPFSIAGKMDPWIILPWAPTPLFFLFQSNKQERAILYFKPDPNITSFSLDFWFPFLLNCDPVSSALVQLK